MGFQLQVENLNVILSDLRFKLELISVIFLLKLNAMLQNQTYKFRSSKIFSAARKSSSISFFAYSCLLQGWTYNYFTHYLLTSDNRKVEHGLWSLVYKSYKTFYVISCQWFVKQLH